MTICLLIAQGNIANSYHMLGRLDDALRTRKDVYSGKLKLHGQESRDTLLEASNYADLLVKLKRFEEARSLLRRIIPVARNVVGDNDRLTLAMRKNYARALYEDPAATLDDLREALNTLEETDWTARRVLGGAHPETAWVEQHLRNTRAALRARETPSTSA